MADQTYKTGEVAGNNLYRSNTAASPSTGGSSVTQGTGQFVDLKTTPKTTPAPTESLGDVAARMKKAKASKPAPSKPAPKTITDDDIPKYHDGKDNVPKTGKAVLKKGEAVLNNKDADKYRAFGLADELGGPEKKKPAKKVKEVRIRKGHGGKGHIVENHHESPMDHPMEEHPFTNQDDMMNHVMSSVGTPNPGEAEADAGTPEAAAPSAAA